MKEFQHYDAVVLGNGFDIALGFPTSYKNFYNSIKVFDEAGTSFDDFSKGIFSLFMKRFDQNKLLPFYDSLKAYRKTNYFIRHIMNQVEIFDLWCDLETEIKKIVVNFDIILGHISRVFNPYSNNYQLPIESDEMAMMFSKHCVSDWNGYKFGSDDDLITGTIIDYKYKGKYDAESIILRTREIKEDIADKLFSELCEMKTVLSKYVDLASSVSPDAIVWNIESSSTITYNYTDTALTILSEEEPYHIHGSTKNEIVLGINNFTEFKHTKFERFTKTSQRSLLGSSSLRETIKDVHIIGYFGLSFDESDRNTLSEFFDVDGAIHCIYFHEDPNPVTVNIQKIVGKDKYDKMFNEKRLRFINCSEAYSKR